ncbi:MAG: 4Fe-4S binding protein [Gudongella sp.]|nr:4Fe-4S binding protein [Gudongella sp.]
MDRPKITKFTEPKKLDEYPMGPAFQSGHLVEVNSGMRTFRPVIDNDKCTMCLRCFLVCPDGTIDKSGEHLEVDYDYCKGCGVCAAECRFDAITMLKEVEI